MIYNCQIVYHPGNCLDNKKIFYNLCRLCVDACPHRAISLFRQIDGKSCTECGVCMAVCPSDGFVYQDTDNLFDYIRSTEKIVLNCPQAILAGYEIPCLGLIDRDLWLTLILYAQEKEVAIFTGVCGKCPDKKACAMSVKTFNEIHSAWPNHPQLKIKVVPDKDGQTNENQPTASLNKEATIQSDKGDKSLKLKLHQKIEKLFPVITSDETYHIPKTRQFLCETWKSRNTNIPVLPMLALTVDKSCTNCGECIDVCPQEALSKRENKGQIALIYEPIKCVHCQRCIIICPAKAISMEAKSLTYRLWTGKVILRYGTD